MATSVGNEVVECVGSGSTLLLSSKAIRCRDWDDLSNIGPSRGPNLVVSDADGTVERDRERGELSVTLRDIQVNGRYDQDGVRQTGDTRQNALTLKRAMVDFFKDGSDRTFTIRLTEYSTVYEADAQFEAWGDWVWETADIANVDLLITVNDGVLTEQP